MVFRGEEESDFQSFHNILFGMISFSCQKNYETWKWPREYGPYTVKRLSVETFRGRLDIEFTKKKSISHNFKELNK